MENVAEIVAVPRKLSRIDTFLQPIGVKSFVQANMVSLHRYVEFLSVDLKTKRLYFRHPAQWRMLDLPRQFITDPTGCEISPDNFGASDVPNQHGTHGKINKWVIKQ